MRPNRAQDFVKLSLRSFVPDVSRYDVVPDAPAFPSDAPPVDGALDAVVLDDESLEHPQPLSPHARLERMVYLADERNICAKFVSGRKIL